MKYVSIAIATLASLALTNASAQDTGDSVAEAPAATPEEVPVADGPEPELSEPEPELSEPEPELSEPEPELSEPAEPEIPGAGTAEEPEPELSDSGTELGRPSDAPSVEEDLQDAEAAGAATEGGAGEDEGGGEVSTADRLGSVDGGQGLPWTFPLTWSNNVTVRTFAPRAQATYDPTYSMTFLAAPRYISPVAGLSFGARMNLTVELTESALTPEERDLEWSDLQLDATYVLPWRPGGFMISTSAIARLPTSQFSRGQDRYFGPTARLMTMRVNPVLQGLIVGASATYTFWAHGEGRLGVGQNRTDAGGENIVGGEDAVTDPASEFACNIAGDNSQTGTLTGPLTGPCDGRNQSDHQVTFAAFASLLPTTRLAINLSFAAIWLVNGDLGDATICPEGSAFVNGSCTTVGDESRTHTNTITSFSMGFSYDILPYLTASMSYSTLAFYPDSDGSIENFFYNENSTLSVGLQFRPSALANQLRSARAEAAEADSNDPSVALRNAPSAF